MDQPEIVNFPRHPAPSGEAPSLLPQFPQVASFLDHFARRIPWWAWVTLTVGVFWWSGRKKRGA